jgi:hypothetical protein
MEWQKIVHVAGIRRRLNLPHCKCRFTPLTEGKVLSVLHYGLRSRSPLLALPVGLALARGDPLQRAPFRLYPHVGIAGEHGAQDVPGDAQWLPQGLRQIGCATPRTGPVNGTKPRCVGPILCGLFLLARCACAHVRTFQNQKAVSI